VDELRSLGLDPEAEREIARIAAQASASPARRLATAEAFQARGLSSRRIPLGLAALRAGAPPVAPTPRPTSPIALRDSLAAAPARVARHPARARRAPCRRRARRAHLPHHLPDRAPRRARRRGEGARPGPRARRGAHPPGVELPGERALRRRRARPHAAAAVGGA